MRLAIVVLGHQQWERYTQPLVAQIRFYASQAELVIVDNGSQPPYPEVPGARIVRLDKNENISRASNAGQQAVAGCDWTIGLNNDVTMTGPLPSFKGLANNNLYGPEMCGNRLVGWCMLFPRRIIEKVGGMDEAYEFYNEVDYCQRVRLAGFGIRKLDLPFVHFGHGSHHLFKDVEKLRGEGRKHFVDQYGFEPV